MPRPNCPSCREPLSAGEFEAPGFWSCLYCEGTWIPGAEVDALSSRAAAAPHRSQWVAVTPAGAVGASPMVCPDCGPAAFAHVAAKGVMAHCCPGCHGIYLPKGVLEAFRPRPLPASAADEAAASIGIAVAGELLWAIVGAALTGG